MPSQHPRLYYPLVLLASLGAVCIPFIAYQYSYSSLLTAGSTTGFLLLVLCALALWWANGHELPAYIHAAVRLGLLAGILWVVEIGINNLFALPIEIRDPIDNLFWLVIAMLILVFSALGTYLSRSMQVGVLTGLVGGTISGLLACCAGIFLVTFGMPLLLRDPVNQAEWSQQVGFSPAPSMAAYFAYQTLAGAFLHLIVLGSLMGLLLGLLGGLSGKFQARSDRMVK